MSGGLISEAKAKAARFCAFRERAPKEVLEKLHSWGLSEVQSGKILEELINENFVDERRFARAFCHDKFELNKWGRIKIRQEISKYNLQAEAVEEGFGSIPEKRYLEILRGLARKKWDSLKETEEDMIKRKRTADYLLRKGFEADLVWDAIKPLG